MTNEEIEIRFKYHAPKPAQLPKYETIRDEAKKLALVLNALCPDSGELSAALTHLDSVVMFANASIARRE